jgi:hypothetical protein
MLRLHIRTSPLGRRFWLYRKFWHASRRICRHLPACGPGHCVWSADSSHHFPVANHPLA